MPVLFVTEIAALTSEQTVDGTAGRISHSYTRAFQVLFSEDHELAQMPADVRNAVDPDSGLAVPKRNEQHPADPFAYARGIKARQPTKELWRLWILEATYSTLDAIEAGDPREPDLDPLLAPPDIEVASAKTSEYVDEDRNGEAIVNANGEYYREGNERDFSRPVLLISKNIALDALPSLLVVQDVINDTGFQINIAGVPVFTVEAKQGKLTNFRARLQRANGVTYWQFSFELHLRPTEHGWIRRQLHRGTRERIDVDGAEKVVTAVDDDGEPVQKEILLDETGRRLAEGSEPHFQEIEIYQEIDFSTLGL